MSPGNHSHNVNEAVPEIIMKILRIFQVEYKNKSNNNYSVKKKNAFRNQSLIQKKKIKAKKIWNRSVRIQKKIQRMHKNKPKNNSPTQG